MTVIPRSPAPVLSLTLALLVAMTLPPAAGAQVAADG